MEGRAGLVFHQGQIGEMQAPPSSLYPRDLADAWDRQQAAPKLKDLSLKGRCDRTVSLQNHSAFPRGANTPPAFQTTQLAKVSHSFWDASSA